MLLYVTDVVEDPTKNADYLAKVAKEKVPVLLVINKIDLLKGGSQQLETIVDRWKELLPAAEVFPTSATERFNVDNLMRRIVELLPPLAPIFRQGCPDRTNRHDSSSPRSSARRSCSTTTRRCPTRPK